MTSRQKGTLQCPALLCGSCGASAALLQSLRAWVPLVARDAPSFDASDFGDKPAVPDDLLADAERLEEFVAALVSDGIALPYADTLLANLGTEAAAKEWSEAEAADSEYQRLLSEVRKTAGTFDTELQSFRRTLRAVAGSSDKDYQKLRSARAGSPDEDDDSAAPPAPTPIVPAAPGARTPSAGS